MFTWEAKKKGEVLSSMENWKERREVGLKAKKRVEKREIWEKKERGDNTFEREN